MGKGVWGIDVSKYSIKAVRLEAGVAGGATLTHSGVFPYDSAGTGDAADLDVQIKSTLAQVKASYKISNEPVVFSLPSHSTFNRLIKLPPVDEAKLPEIVRYEAQSQIPFNIDEVIWDYQYVERDYAPGEEKEVILFAIKRDIVEQFLGNIADLGFNVEAVQFSPVGLFNFLVHDQEMGGAAVALDMGGDNTDLIVIDGTKFWVRNLPITGNDITKALQKAFNIPFEEAEKLKLKAGQSQQAQKIFNAVQPVLRDLVNEINRSMGYYKSISKTSKFEKILLLGNSTKTLNFQKFVSQSLQLPAARIQQLNKIAVGGTIDPGELNENLATIGTALGLALQGIGPTTNRVNLLPEIYRQKKELKKKQPFIVAAVAALFILVGLAYVRESGDLTKLTEAEALGKKKEDLIVEQKKRFEEVKDIKPQQEALEAISTIAAERDTILKIMDEINPNIPDNGRWPEPGRWEARLDDKLWIVDWRFEEKERPKEVAAGTDPNAAARAAMSGGQSKPLPTSKVLVAILEVVIKKRTQEGQGRDFILKTLLNYNPSGKSRLAGPETGKGCVIKNKHWDLNESQWSVTIDHPTTDAIASPVPKTFITKEAAPDVDVKQFWRFRVTLEVPVGPDSRKLALAGEKPAGK